MRREIIIAKLRKQQEELEQIVADLKKEGSLTRYIEEAVINRIQASNHLIETLQDKSFIPGSHVALDVKNEVEKMDKKVEEVIEGVQKIKKLEKEKKKIEKKLRRPSDDE